MKKIIKSPIKIGFITITIFPNFQGVYGLHELINQKYFGNWGITISDSRWPNGWSKKEVNKALTEVFGANITLETIKKNSFKTFNDKNWYFAAILKVKKLSDLCCQKR
jgi:hypothetical protein